MSQGHADLIDALGGGTQIAAALGDGVDREAVYQWKKNGVPWKRRYAISRLAAEAEVPLPPGFLGDETPVGASVG